MTVGLRPRLFSIFLCFPDPCCCFFCAVFGFCVTAVRGGARAACGILRKLDGRIRARLSSSRYDQRLELHVNIRRGEFWAAFT